MNNAECSRIPGHRTQLSLSPLPPFMFSPSFIHSSFFTLTLCIIMLLWLSSSSLSAVFICSLSHCHPFQLFTLSLSSSSSSFFFASLSPWPFSFCLPLCSSVKALRNYSQWFFPPPVWAWAECLADSWGAPMSATVAAASSASSLITSHTHAWREIVCLHGLENAHCSTGIKVWNVCYC